MIGDVLISDLTKALKENDTLKVSTLRFLLSFLKNKEIELRGTRKISDDDVIAVIKKQVKTHEESIIAFEKGNRPDLINKERAELAILKQYLPEEISESSVRSSVNDLLAGKTDLDFGSAMKLAMGSFKGQADGSLVSRLVKEVLTKNSAS